MADDLDAYFRRFQAAVAGHWAKDLSTLISSNGQSLIKMVKSLHTLRQADTDTISRVAHNTILDKMWQDIAITSWKVAYSIHVALDIMEAYREQNTLTQLLNRVAERTDRWILPVIYTVTQELRIIAMEADHHIKERILRSSASNSEKPNKLEEAARTINRTLTVCLNDRNTPLPKSRKWGVYFIISLLFKIYFKLGTISLATSVVRVLNASSTVGDIPSVEEYPKAHMVTFKYYVGILAFMDEEYEKAEEHLQAALNKCHKKATRNQELILQYLLPTNLLLHRRYPQKAVWHSFPRLQTIYKDLFTASKRGDMRSYEAALAARERLFVTRRLYLTMLKIRTKIVRPRLFEQVYLASDKSTRVPVSAFRKGLEFVGIDVDDDQVECWAAVMIYQGQMKGYISRERKIIVLSNNDPFPK
ncbi:hypothetical protein V1506DRAFT_534800 [Lipomyces tetrasporus]